MPVAAPTRRPSPGTRSPRRRAGLLLAVATAAVLAAPAAPAAAADDVDVHVQCVWKNTDGTTTAVWSYVNHTSGAIDIPPGPDNRMTTAPVQRGQPTHFLPGEHLNAWVITYAESSLAWHLLSSGDTANNGSTKCASNPVPLVGDWGAGGLALAVLVPSAWYAVRRGWLPWLPSRRPPLPGGTP